MLAFPTEVLADSEYFALVNAIAKAEQRARQIAILTIDCLATGRLCLKATPLHCFPPESHVPLLELAYESHPAHCALQFPLESYNDVAAICSDTIPCPIFRLARRLAKGSVHVSERELSDRIGAHLWDSLLPFQKFGVLRALQVGDSALLADDMGLGKTLQAIAIAEYRRTACTCCAHESEGRGAARAVLVLCPSMLRVDWTRTIRRWLPHVPRASIHAIMSTAHLRRLVNSRVTVPRDAWDCVLPLAYVVCSYDLLPRLLAQLHTKQWQGERSINEAPATVPPELRFSVVIADECHLLRNMSTVRTKASLPILLHARHRVLVSGTPALSKPAELYPQLHALLSHSVNETFMSHGCFSDRYCRTAVGSNSGMPSVLFEELGVLLGAVMVRRVKTDVMNDLPPKIRVNSTLHLSDARLQVFRKGLSDVEVVRAQLNSATEVQEYAALRRRSDAMLAALYKETATAKIPGVLARLRTLLFESAHPTRKFLVFAHHRQVMDAVEALMLRESLQYVRIDGESRICERATLVHAYQSSKDVRVAILSIAAAGTGITLTSADYVLFAELEWTPGLLIQAEDRAHRIGRKGPVHIEYITASGTLDGQMWVAVKRKMQFVGEVVDISRMEKIVLDPASFNTDAVVDDLDVRMAVTDAIHDAPMPTDVPLETPESNPTAERGRCLANSEAARQVEEQGRQLLNPMWQPTAL